MLHSVVVLSPARLHDERLAAEVPQPSGSDVPRETAQSSHEGTQGSWHQGIVLLMLLLILHPPSPHHLSTATTTTTTTTTAIITIAVFYSDYPTKKSGLVSGIYDAPIQKHVATTETTRDVKDILLSQEATLRWMRCNIR